MKNLFNIYLFDQSVFSDIKKDGTVELSVRTTSGKIVKERYFDKWEECRLTFASKEECDKYLDRFDYFVGGASSDQTILHQLIKTI